MRYELDQFVNLNANIRSDVINSVDEFGMKHEIYLKKNFGRFCGQFETYHSVITTLLHNLNYGERGHLDGRKALQFQLLVNAQKTLYSAYTLFKRGMYDDCAAVLRIVYESFLRVLFISLNPQYPYNAIIRNPSEGPKFEATGLVRDQLKLDWTHYDILSNFTHGNSYRIFLDIDANADIDNPQPITVRYRIDENMISICTNYFYFFSLIHLWLINDHLKPSKAFLLKNEELANMYDVADKAKYLTYEVLSKHPENDLWPLIAVDLRKIFELISAIDNDSGINWKEKWQSIHNSSTQSEKSK